MGKKLRTYAVTNGRVNLVACAALDGEWRALGLAAPARRALVAAGIMELSQLKGHRSEEISALHGMGPSAMKLLSTSLRDAGMSFRSK